MRTLGNILWHIPFLGFITAAMVYLIGLLFTITVVGAPIGLGLMQLGRFLLTPFGYQMINKKEMNTPINSVWSTYSFIVRIIWLPIGIILSIVSLFQAIGLALTIIGIPLAIIIIKTIPTFFNPVNKVCVSSIMAEELERAKAQAHIRKNI